MPGHRWFYVELPDEWVARTVRLIPRVPSFGELAVSAKERAEDMSHFLKGVSNEFFEASRVLELLVHDLGHALAQGSELDSNFTVLSNRSAGPRVSETVSDALELEACAITWRTLSLLKLLPLSADCYKAGEKTLSSQMWFNFLGSINYSIADRGYVRGREARNQAVEAAIHDPYFVVPAAKKLQSFLLSV